MADLFLSDRTFSISSHDCADLFDDRLQTNLKKEVHLAKETGQINLPLHTLESIARSSLKGIVNIDDTQVKVTLTKAQKANVEVAIADNNQQLFLSKGRRVREQIEQALQQMAKLEVDHTKVIFKRKSRFTFRNNK
ncbi:hypothetical protein GQR36_12695 [Enterococcus termitis]